MGRGAAQAVPSPTSRTERVRERQLVGLAQVQRLGKVAAHLGEAVEFCDLPASPLASQMKVCTSCATPSASRRDTARGALAVRTERVVAQPLLVAQLRRFAVHGELVAPTAW